MASGRPILLSTFACDPYFGSDEEVGWQWAHQLSKRGFDVTVITRKTHKNEIERGVRETGHCPNVRFEYIDIEWLYPLTSIINRRNHIYYYFWQWAAFRHAKKLHKEKPFELIHHVTWASFRQPSFMGLVGVPMYFGPVAGADEIPRGYTKLFSPKQKVIECVRAISNHIVRFDPLMWLTFLSAKRVFFTSQAHLARVPALVKEKAQIELAIGCDIPIEQTKPSSVRYGNRLLFVGRCLGWKGMDLGLQVFAKIHAQRRDVTLTVVGDGVDRERWMQTAKNLGIDKAIDWRGWLPKEEVQHLYQNFDVFFYPSLRDSGGFVVLEALQHGLPVVCFKLGGPGSIVDDTCGKTVHADANIEKTIVDYSESVMEILSRGFSDTQLSYKCYQRAQFFTWDSLITRIYGKT